MRPLASLLAGVVFGLGLVISGLANPAKVLNFLDVAGTWDPSLPFVDGGRRGDDLARLPAGAGAAEAGIGCALSPAGLDSHRRPAARRRSRFGVGWGLAGYCPGPAITALPLLRSCARWCSSQPCCSACGWVPMLAAKCAGAWHGGARQYA